MLYCPALPAHGLCTRQRFLRARIPALSYDATQMKSILSGFDLFEYLAMRWLKIVLFALVFTVSSDSHITLNWGGSECLDSALTAAFVPESQPSSCEYYAFFEKSHATCTAVPTGLCVPRVP